MARKPKRNQKKNKSESSERDRCQTPDYAIFPLLPYIPPGSVIWEPARGKGYMELAFRNRGFKVVSGDILTGQNFFEYQAPPEGVEFQITNPAFSIKYDWLEHSYKMGIPFALLMPMDVMGASSAQVLFREYGIEILAFDERVDFHMPEMGWRGTGAQFTSFWFTFGLGIGQALTWADLNKPPKPALEALYDRYEAMEMGNKQLALPFLEDLPLFAFTTEEKEDIDKLTVDALKAHLASKNGNQ